MKFNLKDFPNNEEYFNSALSIPLYPSMTNSNIRKVVKTLKNIFHE